MEANFNNIAYIEQLTSTTEEAIKLFAQTMTNPNFYLQKNNIHQKIVIQYIQDLLYLETISYE